MPYSELHRMTRERLESTQMKLTSSLDNPASVPDDEFVELLWENGQLLMQGQSNKTRKNSPGFTSHLYKAQGHEEGDAVLPKFEQIGNENTVFNDFSSSGQMGLGQDDELVRWLNYPLDDYCSEFFSEFSGVNQSTLSAQNSATHIHKSNSSALIDRDSRRGSTYVGDSSEQGNASKVVREGSDLTPRTRDSKLFLPTLQQCETSIPSHRSRVSEFSARCAYPSQHGESNQNLTSSSGMPNNKIQKQRSETARLQHQPSSNTGFTNFSHFLRPATLVKSNQQNISAIGSPELLHMERIQSNNKASVASSSNLNESTVVESNSVSRSIPGFQSRPISLPGKADVKSFMHKPPKESLFNEQSEAICGEDASWKSTPSDQALGGSSSFAASTAIGRPDSEKGVEPVVGSSSVCSGNSTGGASNDLKSSLKRKVRDNEESEYPSEDVEEESVGVRKAAPARGGTGSKRSRAAEVHNLSERRRRDRINEKMRALQELIPNCNKVDKASMLDEAIEYLKILQLQVQIMSMGTGLYMHPMMFPTGMQQMHASNMTPFSPMSVGLGMGMGMGMGFGMGMLNASGGSSACPLIQVPPMHGAHFPGPPISGPSNIPTITAYNHPMFGLPAPGHPMSMPRIPFIPHSGGSSANSAMLPAVPGNATSVVVPNSITPSCSKDPIENMTIPMLKTDIECSHSQIPIQARDGIEQPALLQINDRVSTPACEWSK